jgi:hypothetical protein
MPGAEAGSDGFSTAATYAVFGFLVINVLLLAFTPLLVRMRVRRLMRSESKDHRGAPESARAEAMVTLRAREEDEEPTRERLTLTPIEVSSNDAIASREAMVARARTTANRTLWIDLLVSLVYLGSSLIGGEGAGIAPAFLLGSRLVARRAYFARQVRADSGGFLLGLIGMYGGVPRPLINGMVIAIAALIATDEAALWPAIAFHVVMMLYQLRAARSVRNLKLVVLRVFNMDRSARLTFKGLLTNWRRFGTFFTVVDKSFLKSQDRRWLPVLLPPLLMLVLFAILSTYGFYREYETRFLLFVALPVMVFFAAAHVFVSLRSVDRSFIGSAADLASRLQRLEASPRTWDLSFKSMPLMCFNDTWQMVVSTCVQESDAVLMDLRGFSETNKGCEKEVDYLLDVKPVERIVFLADSEGCDETGKMILERWDRLHKASPNLKAKAPQARMYVTSTETEKDQQVILDLLLHAAEGGGARIPAHPVADVLFLFRDEPGLFVGAALSDEMRRDVHESCGIPTDEIVLGLIDCGMGPAVHCWGFTDQGLYYRNKSDRTQIPYDRFANCAFQPQGMSGVSVGSVALSLSGSGVSRDTVVDILNRIRDAVRPRPSETAEGTPERADSASESSVSKALLGFSETHGFFVGESISVDQRSNAHEECRIDPDEAIRGIIDLTFLQSAKNCWAFTDHGLYYHYDGKRKRIPYNQLETRSFKPTLFESVRVGSDKLSLSGSSVSKKTAIEILDAVKESV